MLCLRCGLENQLQARVRTSWLVKSWNELIECIQEGLWPHSTWRPFFCNFGLEKEAKGRLSFWYPTGFLNTLNELSKLHQVLKKWASQRVLYFLNLKKPSILKTHIQNMKAFLIPTPKPTCIPQGLTPCILHRLSFVLICFNRSWLRAMINVKMINVFNCKVVMYSVKYM